MKQKTNFQPGAVAMRFLLATLFAGSSSATETLATEYDALLKDMTAVIMLLGMPCDEVISVRQQADKDHIATCKNGNRFRVFINKEGRVVADKQ
jgi:hypothetical protein